MTDIATLGLAIDSRPAVTAAANLDRFAQSARTAEQATERLAEAQRAENVEIARAYGIRQQLTSGQASVIRNYETQIGKQTLLNAGMKREAAQHVAMRSAGVDANSAYGQTVKELSGHLYDLENAQNKAEASSRNLAQTITRRFVMGFITSQIRAMVRAVTDLNSELAKTGDVGRFTGLGGQNIQGIQSAGAEMGIAPAKFLDDMTQFARQVQIAKSGSGDLAALLRQMGGPPKDVADAFERVADRVKSARTDIEKFSILEQASLPATREWVKFMEQGSNAIQVAARMHKGLTDAQLEAADKLEQRFNTLWDKFVRGGKRAVVAVFGDDWTAEDRVAAEVRRERAATQITVNPAPKSGPTPAEIALRIQREQELLSLYGSTTSAMEARRAVELQLEAAGLRGIAMDASRAESLKRLAAENTLGVTAIKASADAQRVEGDTIGMSAGQAAGYAAVLNAINAARRDGRVLTLEGIAQIQREAALLAEATSRAEALRFGYETFSGTLRDVGQQIRQNGLSWESFGKAGLNALGKIADKLADMASQQLWKLAFPTGGGGLGSLFGLGGGGDALDVNNGFVPFIDGGGAVAGMHSGGIVGAETTFMRHVPADTFKGAPRMHGGGVVGADEQATVLQKKEGVFTEAQMRALAPVGSGEAINVTFGDTHISVQGGDPKETQQIIREELARDRRTRQAEIIDTIRRAKSARVAGL